MLRAVLVEEKKMQTPVKTTGEYYCPSGKTVKASGQSCNIYTPYRAYEMVLKCLIYLFNNLKYYLEQL